MLVLTELVFSHIFLIVALASECEKIEYSCGGVITDKNGSITSPSYPDKAPPHSLCKWEIKIPVGHAYSRVILNFTDFQVPDLVYDRECRYSYVEIEGEKYSDEIHKCGKFCGLKPPPISFEGTRLTIEYRSESFGRSSFEVTYKIECTEFSCDNGRCERFRYICFPSDSLLSCTQNGKTPTCTEEMCPLAGGYYCDGKCIWKKRVCDLEYDCSDHSDEKDCEYCGGVITEQNGTITSPNFPDNYPPDSRCKWIFHLKPNTKLKLRFRNFYLGHGFGILGCGDYVTMDEIKNYPPKLSYRKYCGEKPPPITVRNETFFFSFRPDGYDKRHHGLGFEAYFKIECEGLTCDDDKCISHKKVCDGHQDCDDNADESECHNGICESMNMWQCKNGRCILKSKVCNGKRNCADNSDEENCEKESKRSTGLTKSVEAFFKLSI